MDTSNLTLLTDLYELTMMQGYFKTGSHETVVFDAFFRNNPSNGGYAICAGLEQIIGYIKGLHFTEELLNRIEEKVWKSLMSLCMLGLAHSAR